MENYQKLLLTVVIISTASAVVVWALTKAIETYYNIRAINQAKKNPVDPTRWSSTGIIYNKKTGKLESDGGHIMLPFDRGR